MPHPVETTSLRLIQVLYATLAALTEELSAGPEALPHG